MEWIKLSCEHKAVSRNCSESHNEMSVCVYSSVRVCVCVGFRPDNRCACWGISVKGNHWQVELIKESKEAGWLLAMPPIVATACGCRKLNGKQLYAHRRTHKLQALPHGHTHTPDTHSRTVGKQPQVLAISVCMQTHTHTYTQIGQHTARCCPCNT